MNRSSVRQIFALFLGILVTLGLSLSVAQLGAMPAKMVMSSDIGASGQGDCHDCGSAGDVDGKAIPCKGVCVSPAFVALLQEMPGVTISLTTLSPSPEARLVPGWASPPDPYPPRSRLVG